MMNIEEVQVSRLRIPLAQAYKLALGSVVHFDTLLVMAVIDGRRGFGEATILSGYTDETIEDSWKLAQGLCGRIARLSCDAACAVLDGELLHTAPFTVTAFRTALEMANGEPLLKSGTRTHVPLVFGINATDPAGIEREIEGALAAGYRTLKIKAGFAIEADLARIRLIQSLNRGRASLRVDANQGYSRDDGCAFARRVSPDSVELLEQPCHAKDWDAAAAVAAVTAVPLMLDESIYSMNDIDRAARLGAGFVKLKLMKFGSLRRLERGLRRIREVGMRSVLGNGVASDIGCWMEACVARTTIDNAGEMNGYLRQRESILTNPIPVQTGAMRLDPYYVPQLAQERIEALTVEIAGLETAR
jgi:L-alanine-DL-glutamate epimerase-like enolase superfamily enzyme